MSNHRQYAIAWQYSNKTLIIKKKKTGSKWDLTWGLEFARPLGKKLVLIHSTKIAFYIPTMLSAGYAAINFTLRSLAVRYLSHNWIFLCTWMDPKKLSEEKYGLCQESASFVNISEILRKYRKWCHVVW